MVTTPVPVNDFCLTNSPSRLYTDIFVSSCFKCAITKDAKPFVVIARRIGEHIITDAPEQPLTFRPHNHRVIRTIPVKIATCHHHISGRSERD